MADWLEVIYDLSTGATFSDIDLTPTQNLGPLFDVECLRNGKR